jgi:CHAT domain-containing protein
MRRGEGSLNLARPFLHAGARYVLGALWDVADRETEALFESFYRAYAGTAEPIDALRQAQLSALHEYRLGSRGPAAWASFAVYTRVLPRPS